MKAFQFIWFENYIERNCFAVAADEDEAWKNVDALLRALDRGYAREDFRVEELKEGDVRFGYDS